MNQFLSDIIAACREASKQGVPWVRDMYYDGDRGYCPMGYYLALNRLPIPLDETNERRLMERYGIGASAFYDIVTRVADYNDEYACSFGEVADYLEQHREEFFA